MNFYHHGKIDDEDSGDGMVHCTVRTSLKDPAFISSDEVPIFTDYHLEFQN